MGIAERPMRAELFTVWVDPSTAAEIRRRADLFDLTTEAAIRDLLEVALRRDDPRPQQGAG